MKHKISDHDLSLGFTPSVPTGPRAYFEASPAPGLGRRQRRLFPLLPGLLVILFLEAPRSLELNDLPQEHLLRMKLFAKDTKMTTGSCYSIEARELNCVDMRAREENQTR